MIAKLTPLSRLSLLVVLLIGLVSTSCSKRGELLDTIPADLPAVATINVERLCEDAGVKFTSDGIEVAPQLESHISENVRASLTRLSEQKASGAVDLSAVVAGVTPDGEIFFTMSVTDSKAFFEVTADYLTWEDDASGYRISQDGNSAVVASDSQVWILTNAGSHPAKTVDGLLKSAKEMSMSDLDGIAQALSRDNTANIAVTANLAQSVLSPSKSDTEVPAQEREWNVFSLNISPDNALVAEGDMMQSTGRTIVPKGLKAINPALLAYVPERFNFTFAAGLTPEFDWAPLKQIVTLIGGFQAAASMSVITPYLESIDGTLLIAAALPESGLTHADPEDVDFIVMVRMPQAKVNGLISMIGQMCSTAGVSPRMVGEGQMVIPQYGRDWYIGNVDGCFAISTIGFDNTTNNSLAPGFVNRDAAVDLSLGLADGSNMQISASSTNGKGQLKCTIPGSETPILVHLLDIMF